MQDILEKAKQLATQLLADDQNQQPLIYVLLEMAQWKDEQLKEVLKIELLDKIESRLYKAIIECNFDSANAYCYCYNIVAIEAEIDKRALLYRVNEEIGWEYKIMPISEYYKYISEH